MAEPVKVLVVGSVLGEIRAFCDKATALDTKYGPFGMVICIGDFFDDREDQTSIDELLNGTIQIPKTTYIMGGEHKIPEKIQEKASETGGEITVNLFLLNKSTVITTSQGIRIAALGGQYDPASYSSPKYAPSNHATSYDVRKIISHPSITAASNVHHNPNSLAALKAASEVSPAKIDILLTHIPPASIALHTPNVPKELESPIAPPFDDVVRAAMPRYHFVSRPGIFWERDPFGWPGMAETGRCTRFLSIGAFGGTAPEGQKKPRWSYAFSIVPITPSTVLPPLPANATYNPFIPHESSKAQTTSQPSPPGQKRFLPEDDGPQFRWSNEGRDGVKRRRTENTKDAGQARQYTCRICGSTEHKIRDCPQKSKPPEGYVCRRCQGTDHFIRDCPTKDETGDTGGRKPPPGYVCRACGSEAHMIDDCPVVAQNRVEREKTRAKGPPKEIKAEECWFCLSNTKLAKHLLVSLGEECYLSLPKGQLPVTNSDDPRIKGLFPVPGGGELLIIPISHYPTLRSLPPDEAGPALAEIDRYKSAIRSFFASYSCTPIFSEVAKRMLHRVHAQLHVIPVPNSIPHDEIENSFHQVGKQLRIELREGSEELEDVMDNYVSIELPSGKTLVHLIDEESRFPLQFPRRVMASVFGVPDRIDWNNCVESESQEKRQAGDFKAEFKRYDPFI
ncbi:hypothetical protein CPB86DRAFT_747588 [Serendipita vermifera]|nr:hypothetical protein CPB86DRAFT_747588 [Serendipita vermifera]